MTQATALTQSCGCAHPYAADANELDVVLRAAVVQPVGVAVRGRGDRREPNRVVYVRVTTSL